MRTSEDRIIFELDQDREVSLPLSISRRLAAASPEERHRYEIGYGGMDVHWPDIDEDIAVWQVLGITRGAILRLVPRGSRRLTRMP